MRNNKTAIIIQARVGSTRMPSKVILPFFDKKCILDIIIEKIKKTLSLPIIVATTNLPDDNIIQDIAVRQKVFYYRGDEKNVLKRFIDCAKEFQCTTIVRICADNPFLDVDFLKNILHIHQNSEKDYTSYCTKENIPVIKTHYGVFCEVVELNALEKVAKSTNEMVFFEHVTNYIYSFPEYFKIKLIPIPEYLENKNIRLTLDSKEDWDILKDLYKKCVENNSEFNTKAIINLLEKDTKSLEIMKQQIEKYSK